MLCDSDYDWGQDTKRLAARLKQLGATQVNYGYVNSHDETFLEAYPGLPRSRAYIRCSPPKAGRRSAPRRTTPRNTAWNIAIPNLKPWYSYLPVKERVGTIDLLYLAPGSLDGKPARSR